MKYGLMILSLFLMSCGIFEFTPNGHRVYYKALGGQFSCYTSRCCYPYKEKVMLCTEPDGINKITVTLQVTLDK